MAISEETVTDFMTLFWGRVDAYGSDHGECIKKPLDRQKYWQHLLGLEPIGVYPCVPIAGKLHVVWGCSDFDMGEQASLDAALKLREAFFAGGVIAYIERSRSKGYHVWVFAEHPVPAVEMRNMFLAAHQVADVPATEVNPKQTTLQQGQYGNYVRLPYPNAEHLTENQRILDPWGKPFTIAPLRAFVSHAMANRTSDETIRRLAGMYTPPDVQRKTPLDTVYNASLDEAMKVLSPLGKVIWRDGPLAGRDRSSTLAKLGYECVRSGLNPSQTKVIIVTADKRWGKYHLRPNGENEIDKLVIRVHN